MAALILPRRFYSQPQGLVEVDVGNPLVRGLVDVFNPLSLTNVTSILRYMPSVAAGTITPSAGQMGRSITLPAATLGCGLIVAESADTLFPSSTDATIFVVRRSLDTTARQSSLFGYNGGDANRVSVNGPWSDGNIYFDFGGIASSQRISTTFAKSTNVDYLVFVAGGGKGREIWRNKVKIAGDATKTGSRPSSALNVRIGGIQSVNSDSDEIYLFGVVDRAWSDGEIATWFDNPWQIFRAKPRVLYFDVAAGGGATLITTSDTLIPGLTEVQASLVTSSTTDTLLPSVTESVSLAVLVAAVDTLTASVTEAQTSLQGADVTDTVLVSVTEALASFIASSLTDTLAPSVTDVSATGVTLEVLDTATPAVTEATNTQTALAISDTVTPSLIEAQASLVYAVVAEALTLSLGEVQGSLLASSVTDVFTLTVTEATSLLLGITATDTFIISVTDTASVVSTTIIEKIGADILAPHLTEAASLVLLDTWVKDGVVVGVWTASGGIVDGWTAADVVTGTWSEEPPFN